MNTLNRNTKALIIGLVVIVLAIVAWFLFGNGKGMFGNAVQVGNTVAVDYVGKTEDGKIFDTSLEQVAKDNALFSSQRAYAPLEFTVGSGQMIPGFENAVKGMHVGEEKTVSLNPDEAYGQVREDLVVSVSGAQFAQAGITPQVGETYQTAQGMTATVKSISGDTVIMDYNSPLAGKTLIFTITVKEIK